MLPISLVGATRTWSDALSPLDPFSFLTVAKQTIPIWTDRVASSAESGSPRIGTIPFIRISRRRSSAARKKGQNDGRREKGKRRGKFWDRLQLLVVSSSNSHAHLTAVAWFSVRQVDFCLLFFAVLLDHSLPSLVPGCSSQNAALEVAPLGRKRHRISFLASIQTLFIRTTLFHDLSFPIRHHASTQPSRLASGPAKRRLGTTTATITRRTRLGRSRSTWAVVHLRRCESSAIEHSAVLTVADEAGGLPRDRLAARNAPSQSRITPAISSAEATTKARTWPRSGSSWLSSGEPQAHRSSCHAAD